MLPIQTQDCVLRPFAEKDLDLFTEYRNNLGWMRWQSYKGLDKQTYRKELLKEISFSAGSHIAIADARGDTLLGDIYLKEKQDGVFWIGYTIHPRYARLGYISQVVLAVTDRLRQAGAVCVNAGVLRGNTASARLLEHCGFLLCGEEEDEWLYTLNLQRV